MKKAEKKKKRSRALGEDDGEERGRFSRFEAMAYEVCVTVCAVLRSSALSFIAVSLQGSDEESDVDDEDREVEACDCKLADAEWVATPNLALGLCCKLLCVAGTTEFKRAERRGRRSLRRWKGACCSSHVARHTSHVTRYTSHVTRYTSHVTRHTSYVTLHTSRTRFGV